nr:unnamed protein product [Spirometra erinaceieuropaei]
MDVEQLPFDLADDVDFRSPLTAGVHWRSGEQEVRVGDSKHASLLDSVGDCKCFQDCPVVDGASRRSIMNLVRNLCEVIQTSTFQRDITEAAPINGVEDLCQTYGGDVELAVRENNDRCWKRTGEFQEAVQENTMRSLEQEVYWPDVSDSRSNPCAMNADFVHDRIDSPGISHL